MNGRGDSPAITFRGVTKRYGGQDALQRLPRDRAVGEPAHRPSARDRLIDVHDRPPPSTQRVYLRYAKDSITQYRIV